LNFRYLSFFFFLNRQLRECITWLRKRRHSAEARSVRDVRDCWYSLLKTHALLLVNFNLSNGFLIYVRDKEYILSPLWCANKQM
jgi:hypothetical protein